MENTTPHSEKMTKLEEMIKDVEIAMLTTVEADGTLHSRPMALNNNNGFTGDLWFFTYGQSHKAEEIDQNPRVNVSFAEPRKQVYVSMSGRASLVRDREKIQELWVPSLKAWFPEGVDEPDIALLKVSVEKAEYWDAPSSAIAHAISLVKSLATGEPANPGEHGEVAVREAA